ncbi:MAG: hypothetical protein MHM6MM_008306, partial [Cercozoa sp. M6MM]
SLGCGMHNVISDTPMCYVRGGKRCPSAHRSSRFAGAYWRTCTLQATTTPATSTPSPTPGPTPNPTPTPTQPQSGCRCATANDGISAPGNSYGCAEWNAGRQAFCYVVARSQNECVAAFPSSAAAGDSPLSAGVRVANLGCAAFNPNAPEFCYVVGGAACSAAFASQDVPGAYWRQCSPGIDPPGNANGGGDCGPRIRREWRHLSDAEQQLFLEALYDFRRAGAGTAEDNLFDRYRNLHRNPDNGIYSHGTAWFLPWHRWFMWNMENSLRAMAPKYRCITVPYWDWTQDAGREADAPVFGSRLFGSNSNNGCVQDSRFGQQGGTPEQCILRNFNWNVRYPSPAEVAGLIVTQPTYAGFAPRFEIQHNQPHDFVNGDMATFNSPNDPLFYLHHSTIDMMFELWQACHGHDRVPTNELSTAGGLHYAAQQTRDIPDRFDDMMNFIPGPLGATVTRTTPRQVYHLPEDIYFEAGTLTQHMTIRQGCSDLSHRFVDVGAMQARTPAEVEVQQQQRERRGVDALWQAALALRKAPQEIKRMPPLTLAVELARADCERTRTDWVPLAYARSRRRRQSS